MWMFGITGSSGSGKTTLITHILPLIRARGLRGSAVKHAHHGFDLDRPGKDSYRYREAGAEEVMLVADGRWALLHERQDADDVSLAALIRRMTPVDVVLVEGFRLEPMPKLEVYRPSLGKPAFFMEDPGILAVACDVDVETGGRILLKLNDPAHVVDFILGSLQK